MNAAPIDIPESVVRDYQRAYRLVEEQRYFEARPILKACIDAHPQFIAARKEYALVLRKLGELDAALIERRAVKVLVPTDEPTRCELITVLVALNRYDEACAEASELCKLRPLSLAYQIMARKVSRMRGKSGHAIIPSGLLELVPRTAIYRERLIDLLSRGENADALSLIERQVGLNTSDEKLLRLIVKLRNLASHGQIFISYRSTNANAARSVAEMLMRNDFSVWFAEYCVLTANYDDFAADLDRNLKAALASCRTAIVFANDDWASSTYCQSEIQYISEHREQWRVIQICVPRQDSRPAIEWAILRDVPTRVCAFSEPRDIHGLFAWLLDELTVATGDRNSCTLPDELGVPVPILDSYRGGAVGSLRVGPFSQINTPFWNHVSNLADLESLLRGYPSVTFEWAGKAPGSLCSLIVDARVNRWTGVPGQYHLHDVDDRHLYHHLRSIARGGYGRHGTTQEGGLHLFHYNSRGQLALTFRTPVVLGHYFWKRIYVLIVQNKIDGTYGEVNLVFTNSYPCRISPKMAFREFCGHLPLFDGIAGSLNYEGYQTRKIRLSVRMTWMIAGAACTMFTAALLQGLLGVSIGLVGFAFGAVCGSAIGFILSHRLMAASRVGSP